MLEDDKSQRLLGEMQSDIRHLQSDVTDIKAEQRIRFDKVDARFEKIDDKVDARFNKIDDRLGKLERALASAKVWAVLLYVALAGTMLAVMAHGFKWI